MREIDMNEWAEWQVMASSLAEELPHTRRDISEALRILYHTGVDMATARRAIMLGCNHDCRPVAVAKVVEALVLG